MAVKGRYWALSSVPASEIVVSRALILLFVVSHLILFPSSNVPPPTFDTFRLLHSGTSQTFNSPIHCLFPFASLVFFNSRFLLPWRRRA